MTATPSLGRGQLRQPRQIDRLPRARELAGIDAVAAHRDAEPVADEPGGLAAARRAIVLLVDELAAQVARALVAGGRFALHLGIEARREARDAAQRADVRDLDGHARLRAIAVIRGGARALHAYRLAALARGLGAIE